MKSNDLHHILCIFHLEYIFFSDYLTNCSISSKNSCFAGIAVPSKSAIFLHYSDSTRIPLSSGNPKEVLTSSSKNLPLHDSFPFFWIQCIKVNIFRLSFSDYNGIFFPFHQQEYVYCVMLFSRVAWHCMNAYCVFQKISITMPLLLSQLNMLPDVFFILCSKTVKRINK